MKKSSIKPCILQKLKLNELLKNLPRKLWRICEEHDLYQDVTTSIIPAYSCFNIKANQYQHESPKAGASP